MVSKYHNNLRCIHPSKSILIFTKLTNKNSPKLAYLNPRAENTRLHHNTYYLPGPPPPITHHHHHHHHHISPPPQLTTTTQYPPPPRYIGIIPYESNFTEFTAPSSLLSLSNFQFKSFPIPHTPDPL